MSPFKAIMSISPVTRAPDEFLPRVTLKLRMTTTKPLISRYSTAISSPSFPRRLESDGSVSVPLSVEEYFSITILSEVEEELWGLSFRK